MKNTLTLILSITLLLSSCGGTDNGNVPTCEQLDSSEGQQIAKDYLKGSWIEERKDEVWGKWKFTFDGENLNLSQQDPDSENWNNLGAYKLTEVEKYKETTTYGCTEYVFKFYQGTTNISIIVESMRGVCVERTNGRKQFVLN